MKTDNANQTRISIHLAILSILAVVLYANSLPNGFSVDDFQFVVNNGAVHGFSWQKLTALFTSVPNRMEYLPIKDLTYALDLSLFGVNPFALHASNIFWYILASSTFYLFLRELLAWLRIDAPLLPLVAGLLFVTHPMHVASVASICQRKDLVSAFLLFPALSTYLRYRSSGRRLHYAAALLLFAAALLSKATVMTMPLFFLALEWFAPREKRLSAGQQLYLIAPFVIAVGIFVLVERHFLLETGVLSQLYSSTVHPAIRAATAAQGFIYYLKLLVWPYPLLMLHDFSFVSKAVTLATLLSAVGILLFSAGIWLFRKVSPLISLGGVWLLATLLPVSGLIPSNTIIAERYLFLPLAGFSLILAACWQMAAGRGMAARRLATIVLLVMVSVYSALTIRRNPDWHDNLTLLLANARDLPNKAGVYYQIGAEYFALGEIGSSLEYLAKAKLLNPFYEIHYAVHTAALAYQAGNLDQAKSDLDGIQHPFKMQVTDVNYLYGKLWQAKGDLKNAAIYYRNALKSTIPIGLTRQADIADALQSLETAK